MLLFRSEEHVDRWCAAWQLPQGGILTPGQIWQLADAWYSADRRDAGWRRRTVDETEALFISLGMTGDFWSLR